MLRLFVFACFIAFATALKPYVCGDLLCNGAETCTSCPSDCGPCPPSSAVVETCVPAVGDLKYTMTFDDGPAPGVTDKLLDLLKQENIKVTFFVIAEQITGDGIALMNRAISEGHLVLSHTWNHPDLLTLNEDQIRDQMNRSEIAYRKATCRRFHRWMRPPYGNSNANVQAIFNKLGYTMITWNLDTNDWQQESVPNGQTVIVNNFKPLLDKMYPKSIISLEHDLYPTTVAAVGDIIKYIKSKNYTFIRMDECLLGPGINIDNPTYPNFGFAERPEQYGCFDDYNNLLGGAPCTQDAHCGNGKCTDGHCVCNTGYTCARCTTQLSSMNADSLCPPQPQVTLDNSTTPAIVCGDSKCDATAENCSSCPSDCGKCPPVCGDGKCEGPTENCSSCESDCGRCPPVCGDKKCEAPLENCTICTADCGLCPCGDFICNNDETCTTCQHDCGDCQAASTPFYSCPVGTAKLALTFDDGPTAGVTDKLLDLLKAQSAKATFFVDGAKLASNQTDMVNLVLRMLTEGHIVLSRAFSNVDLTTMTTAQIRESVGKVEKAYRAITCERIPRYIRPPFGSINSNVESVLHDMGYQMILWDIAPQDWAHMTTVQNSQTIADHIRFSLDQLYPKNVISIQHDTNLNSVDAVSSIIQYARSKGYTIVPMDECMLGKSNARGGTVDPFTWAQESEGHYCP